MQTHNNILIAECSAYDFKKMLERKKRHGLNPYQLLNTKIRQGIDTLS